ncbi:MAG: hypothetical protein OEV94_08315 [Deltaproteobacteria bacterium]|nr:hypothetical protein [Deltaproteobacteria bacterium]
MAPPVFPHRATLPALQLYVNQAVAHRGFTRDPNEILILLLEEVGELTRELEGIRGREPIPAGQLDALAEELADVFLFCLDLANRFGLEMDNALRERLTYAGRTPPEPGIDLAGWLAAVANSAGGQTPPEIEMMRLTGFTGAMARAIRRHWKKLMEPAELAASLAGAVETLLVLSAALEINLPHALAHKEQKNAGRTWAW